MKLIPYEMGGEVCGWHSDDAARLYWYKSEHTGGDRAPAAPERLTAYVIGHTGIVMGEHVIVEIAALDFLGPMLCVFAAGAVGVLIGVLKTELRLAREARQVGAAR